MALPYDNAAKLSLKADDFFLYFMLLLFFVALISLLYLSDRFGKAVSGLRDFLVSTENNRPDFDKVRFPDTELGEIGNRIVNQLPAAARSRTCIDTEREKLIRHFHYSDEGICIFSPDGDKIYANSHFIQHLNTILDEPTSDATAILRAKDFRRPARIPATGTGRSTRSRPRSRSTKPSLPGKAVISPSGC